MAFLLAYLTIVLVMSLVTFVAYGVDKRRAQADRYRVSEKSLHLVALFGGWPGAWLARRTFRHKTQKLPFLVISWMIVLVHVSLVLCIVYFWVL